jgi:hypothetical protein
MCPSKFDHRYPPYERRSAARPSQRIQKQGSAESRFPETLRPFPENPFRLLRVHRQDITARAVVKYRDIQWVEITSRRVLNIKTLRYLAFRGIRFLCMGYTGRESPHVLL